MSLISDLLHFREEAARREGIESFKVLSKANLDAIAFARPTNKEELTALKGIKEAKYKKYGSSLLAIVAAHTVGERALEVEEGESQSNLVLSVNDFLEAINTELSGFAARVQGEVTDMNIWQNRVVFFSLKDKELESVIKCSMSYQHYQLSGADFTIGTEIIAEGYPKIYKPRGELSFQVMTVELFGEGALKKAYDELYKKLELTGAFDPNQKKPIPEYPERIALITSLDGAAIGDFQMNIGRFGLKIDLYPSGVEGNRAIHELVAAVKAVKARANEYDVLVMVRGGGSLESLQAFNNEALIEMIRSLPIPVLAGIGHEKDITLSALVADRMESTPTACALFLTANWEAARENIYTFTEKLPRLLENRIFEHKEKLGSAHQYLFQALADLKESVSRCEQQFFFWLQECLNQVKNKKEGVSRWPNEIVKRYQESLAIQKTSLENFSQYLAQVDPNRVLALGYSIIRKGNGVLRNTKDTAVGDILSIRLEKGGLTAEVKTIK
jgi:exodeoxyribonuclease VII large subunit